MTTSTNFDTEPYQVSFTETLRRHVGVGRPMSILELEQLSGVSERKLRSYQSGASTPHYPDLMRILAAMPTTFADDVLHPAGIGGVHRLSNEEPNVFRLMKWMGKALKHFAGAMADGHFCERDKRNAVPILQKIGGMCLGWSGRWRRT